MLVEGDDNNEPIADALRGLLDGHIVLSRALASESHWPPIDILDSLSRLQPHLVRPEINQAVAGARRLMADYRDNRDLISIGAYRAGSDPDIDLAIAIRNPINEFLRQPADQLTTLDQSQSQLTQLVQGAAAAAELARNNQNQLGQPQTTHAAQAKQAQANPAPARQAPATQAANRQAAADSASDTTSS